mgnify:CR=1 FL=1
MIISDNDAYLRRVARERYGYNYLSNILPYDIEFALSKIFERELHFVRNVENILADLRIRTDFNVADIFNQIDLLKLSYINGDSYILLIQN